MTGIMTPGSMPAILDPRIKKLFGAELSRKRPEFIGDKITDDATNLIVGGMIRNVRFIGSGLPTRKEIGVAAAQTSISHTSPKVWESFAYANMATVARETEMDSESISVKAQAAKSLAYYAAMCRELELVNLLNNAFDSSVATGDDGKELCATDHVVLGGTQSNEGTAAALSITSLENAVTNISLIRDDANIEMGLNARYLVVPKALAITAQKLMASLKVPGTTDNDANVVRDMFASREIVSSPFLDRSSSTAWFVMTSAEDGLFRADMVAPEIEMQATFEKDLNIRMYFRMIKGWHDWRKVYGNLGA